MIKNEISKLVMLSDHSQGCALSGWWNQKTKIEEQPVHLGNWF